MAEMTERIIIKETSCTFFPETTFTGKLETIISFLTDMKEEGEWEGIETIDVGYDGDVEYCLYKHRPETDEEYAKRMKELEKKKEKELKAKERRRKEYEKLRKEFG